MSTESTEGAGFKIPVTSDHYIIPNTNHDARTASEDAPAPPVVPAAASVATSDHQAASSIVDHGHRSPSTGAHSKTATSLTGTSVASEHRVLPPPAADRDAHSASTMSLDQPGPAKHHDHHDTHDGPEPTAKTPLLGFERHDKSHGIPRIPTFIESSIPTKRSLLSIWFSIFFNIITDIFIPLILYYSFSHYVGTLWALVISGIPPAIVILVTAIRDRKADGVGILMITSFVLSAMLATFQDDPKLFIIRESLITLSMGILFLFTLVPITFRSVHLRPFLFYTARQLYAAVSDADPTLMEQHWDWLWHNRPRMRRGFRIMTAVCGVGLISEFAFRAFLLYGISLSIEDVIYWSNVYVLGILFCLVWFTISYSRGMVHHVKKDREREHAERLANMMRSAQEGSDV